MVSQNHPCGSGWDPRARHSIRLPHDHPQRPGEETQGPQGDPHECHAQCRNVLPVLL